MNGGALRTSRALYLHLSCRAQSYTSGSVLVAKLDLVSHCIHRLQPGRAASLTNRILRDIFMYAAITVVIDP